MTKNAMDYKEKALKNLYKAVMGYRQALSDGLGTMSADRELREAMMDARVVLRDMK